MLRPTILLFEPVVPDAYTAVTKQLTLVQQRQLEAALNYHALIHPKAEINAVIGVGNITQVPALTDASTVSGTALTDADPVGEFHVLSCAAGQTTAAQVTRSIRISHPKASPATTRPPEQFSFPRRVYRALEKRGPVILDDIREFLMKRRERRSAEYIVRYDPDPEKSVLTQAFDRWGRTPAPAPEGAPQAILFGLHWLQTGGAERWAVESIQIAKDAGFLPIIVTDQNSVHPWLDRSEFDGCLLLTLSFDHQEREINVPLIHALLENFNIPGVVLHHSQYLYQMLPWIKEHRPEIRVVSSLHIVEYLNGGYPGASVHFDEYIDTHHVISPQLVEWLSVRQSISTNKLELAPLTTLTANGEGTFTPRDPNKPFTIAFVGRLSRQKRPDVFLGLVTRLKKKRIPFRAILHGDGEMRSIVQGLISQFKLDAYIEQRFEEVPVSETLAESNLLVVTSINEGLTLTTFEAISAGIPVISADVGSQRTIVQGPELLPRPARQFIRGAAKLIAQYDSDDSLRERTWKAQQQQVKDFSTLPSAHTWMKEHFESWQA